MHDDVVADFSHAAIIGNADDALDAGRLVAGISNHQTFAVSSNLKLLRGFIFRELASSIKTLNATDRVKLIVVDLDDTLWRGVAADTEMEGWRRTEGWPLGFVEALLYFKRRGGLLAICSKNDEEPTLARFKEIWGARLRLDDFVAVKISWRDKSRAIAEILAETNILTEHALFVDDNPRELAEVAAAHPGLRCLGDSHLDWRRIILRSPETQVDVLTDEARRRTQLVQARVTRNASSTSDGADRATWLRDLNLRAKISIVDEGDEKFSRAFELLNKTNQFNTTGRRWKQHELSAFLRDGGRLISLSLRDRLLDNGLVALALVRPGEIMQIVLSCRVFGLGAEQALGAVAMKQALHATNVISALYVNTGRNLACEGFLDGLGFAPDEAGKLWAYTPARPPPWIRLEL